MVTMARSAANWRNTHTLVDRTHSLAHFTSTPLQPRGAKRQLSKHQAHDHTISSARFSLQQTPGLSTPANTTGTWPYNDQGQLSYQYHQDCPLQDIPRLAAWPEEPAPPPSRGRSNLVAPEEDGVVRARTAWTLLTEG